MTIHICLVSEMPIATIQNRPFFFSDRSAFARLFDVSGADELDLEASLERSRSTHDRFGPRSCRMGGEMT